MKLPSPRALRWSSRLWDAIWRRETYRIQRRWAREAFVHAKLVRELERRASMMRASDLAVKP